MADDDARLGHELADALGERVDRVHAVVDEVDLPAALELGEDRLAHERVVPLRDECLDRLAVLGRRVHRRHVADPGERHVQRARDRRGREREHVDLEAHALEPLLVAHAEALLLVDHDQSEVLELDAGLQQAMRADHDVDVAALEALDDRPGLLVRAEAREHLDADGEGREALAEGAAVLLREHGRRHEHRDLVAVLDGLERGA